MRNLLPLHPAAEGDPASVADPVFLKTNFFFELSVKIDVPAGNVTVVKIDNQHVRWSIHRERG
jgi:hypothetical protein